MALLQSLGLTPAKNAIRKLFRRSSPADEEPQTKVTASRDSKMGASKLRPHLHSNSSDAANVSASKEPPSRRETVQTTPTQDASSMPAIVNQYSSIEDKENRPPGSHALADLASSLKKLSLDSQDAPPAIIVEVPEDPAVLAERAHHLRFIGEALDMARLALRTNETPVGCVLVHHGTIIAKGMNATNVTRNGTRHAEFMAISALLSRPPEGGPRTTSLKPKGLPKPLSADDASDTVSVEAPPPDEGNEDGMKGHLYPYGQKLQPDARVSREILRECILYVTVEPCVMCASLLRQLGIKKVYFGAVNDKFGGTGGVFSIHANSLPVRDDGQTASAHPTPRPSQLPDGSGTLGVSYPPGGGDGGNVEAGYEIEGGWGRDEAVGLLRRFYVQENGRAPVPRKKEGRAARLAAMMEKDDDPEAHSAQEGQETTDEGMESAESDKAGEIKLSEQVFVN